MLKIGEIRYIYPEDYKPREIKSDINILYFTDAHFGKKAKFRSDNHDESLFRKLDVFSNYKVKLSNTEDYISCFGGDLSDTPRVNQRLNFHGPSLELEKIDRLSKFIKENEIECIIGNHDIEHETDWKDCISRSPIQLMPKDNYFYDKYYEKIEIQKKHWKPDYSQDEINFKYKNKVKILMTHEALMRGSAPFNAVQMETYNTDANIVLCADIHTHQGVHQYNETIFISPGAMTRTHSGEKDKKPFFAHIRINNGVVDVDFIHFLPKDDNPDLYWVDVRDKTLTKKQKKEIEYNAGEALKDELSIDVDMNEEELNLVLKNTAKKIDLKDEEIEELILL